MEHSGHIMQVYDEELQKLTSQIIKMGGLAEAQLANAIEAVIKRDSHLAERTVAADRQIDEWEQECIDFAIQMIALRQPMADDLRLIVAATRLAADIERIGDYAKNIAKRAIALNRAPPIRPVYTIPRMGALVQDMIKRCLDAFAARDAEAAMAVWRADEEVDATYNSLFRELLTYMMEDPRYISTGTHLLFVAKNIERMGDLTTNIAEAVHFIATGSPPVEDRPKGDVTAFAMVSTNPVDPDS